MQKKILGILLTLCMLLGLFPFTVGTAALAADETTGKVHLRSAADVLELMNDSSLWGADILLENDIDLSVYEGTLTQTPIGTASSAFTGSFDGAGHKISGIAMTATEAASKSTKGYWGFFGLVTDAEISGLTVAGSVSGPKTTANEDTAAVGGLVAAASGTVTITNCTNECAASGYTRVGGILGIAKSGTVLSVDRCRNNAAISGTEYVAGIVGRADQAAQDASNITNCLNGGEISASASNYGDVGGIAGLTYSTNILNCMNTAAVSGTKPAKYAVGGIVGRVAPGAGTTAAVSYCYNAGVTSGTTPYAIVGTIQVSGTTGTFTVSDSYYKTGTGNNQTGDSTTEVDPSTLTSGEDCKTMFAGLPSTSWTYTPTGPELTAFHTHNTNLAARYDNDSHWYVCDCYGYSGDGVNIEPHDFGADNICTACGTEKTTCAHTEVITEEVTSSTCSKAGTGNRVCAECGLVLETDVELPLDPDTHDGTAEILLSGDKVAYRCSACGATVKTESRAPLTDVYTASNGMTLDVGYISDAIGTESKPFASFADALAYAAASANVNAVVTVHITGTVDLPTAYAMPDYTGAVTVTGGTVNFTGTTAAEQSFRAGGTLTFENIAFTSAKSRVGARIFAQNHKLVMGEGITMQNNDPMTINATYSADGATVDGVKMYIFGGFASGEAPAEMNTDITVRSGEYWEICGWNNGDKGTAGTAKITIGKTNDSDTLISTYLVPFSDNTNSLTADSSSDVIVDGNIDIYRVYLNSAGGNSAGSTYTTNFVLKGAINGTHYQYETKADYPASYRYGYDLTYSTKATSAVVNVYTDLRLDSAKANAYPFFGDGAEIAADTATGTTGHTVASYTYYDYCRDVLGGHTDLDSDNFCDECGAQMTCAHTEGYAVVDSVASTCMTQGSEGHKCNACGIVYETVALPLDPNNHEKPGYVWYFDGETGVYYQLCAGCGARHTEQVELPTVYVDGFEKTGTTGLSTFVGDDANSGAAADTAVKTIEEAVRRLAATGGRIILADDYIVSGDVTLPAYARTITFSAVTTSAGAPRAGFVFTAARKRITLGGPTEFTAIRFDATNRGSVLNNDGGNIPFIVADWNDVTFTGGVETYGMLMFVGGRHMATTNDDAVKTVDFRFDGITAKAAGSGDTAKTYPSFRYLYLCDAEALYLNGDSTAAENLTVSNKTVNAVLTDVTARYIVTVCGSSSPISVQTANSRVSLTLDGNSRVEGLYTGWSNTGNAKVGTAFIDELTINLNGNATVTSTMSLYNARNLTLNIAPHDSKYRITAPIKVLMNGVYTPTGSETAVLNYGTHSIAGTTALPTVADGYTATVNKTDECLFGEWSVTTPATPETNGEATRTCSECGRTETKSVPYACTHSYIAAANGTIYCDECGETFESLTAPVLLSAQAGNIENGQFEVIVKLDSTTPLTGVDFSIDATEGITLTGVSSLLPEATMDADPSTLTSLSFAGADELTLPYRMVVLDMALGNKTYTATEVVKLTFAVADGVTEGKVTMAVTDAYFDVDPLEAAAVGAEVTAAAHTHEYTSEVTKEATCGEDGVRTYTCTCGDSYTEAIPATGEHTYTSEVTKEATCVEAGEMTHTCSVCGHSYTEPIPATGKHTFGEWVETTPAQPGVAGEETRTCTVCGATETRATDPLPEVPETYAAYIGETGYATVQAAMDAAKALDTITVEADVVETVTPKTTVYLAGDYSGITISGDYTLDVTGRYMRSGDSIVEDTIVKYTPAAVMAIVRPNAVTENSAILSKQTLVLKSSVEYKIQARKATVDAYEAFYAVIDLCSADGSDITSPTADAKARRLIITDKVLEGSTYIYVADGIPASCMGNTIRVTFYGINADGTVDYRTLSDNSIAAKLYEFGATGDAEMNLAAALLNYGAAAQTNFGYNTANLVNASLAAELQRSSLADYSDTVLNGTRTIDELVEGETAVFTATKITGELLDKIVLNITLRPADTTNKDYSDLTFVCEYTDYLGAAQTVVIPSSEWNTSGSMPIVKLDRLSAANLRQKLTINIYSGYGTEAQSRVLKTHYLDGFEYTATTGQATSNPEALRVLYYSIMHYSDMAKAYLAQ